MELIRHLKLNKIFMSDKKHAEYQYLDLLQEILDIGTRQEDRGTGVITHSIFGRQIRFDLSKGFPLLTTKKVFWKGVLYELIWFMSGQTNIKFLVDNGVHIWDDYPYRIYREKMEKGEEKELTQKEFIQKIMGDSQFAEKHGELRHIYGEMWRKWPAKNGRTVDQLQWLVENLRRDPDAHNALVNSWNPEFLYEMAEDGRAIRFPICHNMYQCSVRKGKLSLQLYQRTADMFLGVPFNIASYALLAQILARVTGNEPGEFIHTFGDAHIYDNHITQVKEQLSREPKKFSEIKLDSGLNEIDDFEASSVELVGYEAHPPIKAKLSPTGGIVTDSWKKFVKKKKV